MMVQSCMNLFCERSVAVTDARRSAILAARLAQILSAQTRHECAHARRPPPPKHPWLPQPALCCMQLHSVAPRPCDDNEACCTNVLEHSGATCSGFGLLSDLRGCQHLDRHLLANCVASCTHAGRRCDPKARCISQTHAAVFVDARGREACSSRDRDGIMNGVPSSWPGGARPLSAATSMLPKQYIMLRLLCTVNLA